MRVGKECDQSGAGLQQLVEGDLRRESWSWGEKGEGRLRGKKHFVRFAWIDHFLREKLQSLLSVQSLESLILTFCCRYSN